MSDMRPICNACGKRMSLFRIGVEIDYPSDQVQRGDLYRCETDYCRCQGYEVVASFGKPYPKVKAK